MMTGTPPSRPTRNASSIASNSESSSDRMWVMYVPCSGAMACASATSSAVVA